MIFNLKTAVVAAVLATASLPQIASAQSAGGDWTFTVAPYLWATGLSGTVATIPGAPSVDVDASFSDILENLDAAAMVVANANNGRFGVSADLQYYKISTSKNPATPKGPQINLLVRETIFTLMGDYKISSGPGHELWAQAGVRYWDVQNDIATIPAGGGPGTSTSGQDDWIDPVIGLRGRRDVSENGFLIGWAYVGGFGAGSEEMVDIFGGYGHKFTETTSAVIGYRYMMVDRVDNGFVFNVEQSGPMLGLRFQF